LEQRLCKDPQALNLFGRRVKIPRFVIALHGLYRISEGLVVGRSTFVTSRFTNGSPASMQDVRSFTADDQLMLGHQSIA
jgi:hypothetical protein